MNESKIPVRYAKALIQSSVGQDVLDKVYNDMMFIAGVCKIDEVKEVLASPIILPSKKKTILHGILEGNIEKITLSLIDLLLKNGRESFLPAIIRVFRDDTLKIRGITETNLTTAIPVSDNIRKQITELVSSVFKTKVQLNEVVDDNIIGGFILKVNDNYIDASVRNKLRIIKKGLTVRLSTEEG